jgi:hypothetical protein
MDGEAANVAETPGHPVRIGSCRRRRPSQGSLDGQMLFATMLDEGEELSQELLGTSEPVTKGAPHGQVISEGLTEDVHAASPGQGRAIIRKVSRSTLA